MPPNMTGHPPVWGTYFAVDDCFKVAEVASTNGAKVLYDPITMEGTGTFTSIQDPQGATFSIMQNKGAMPPPLA